MLMSPQPKSGCCHKLNRVPYKAPLLVLLRGVSIQVWEPKGTSPLLVRMQGLTMFRRTGSGLAVKEACSSSKGAQQSAVLQSTM